jgi:hypothetical protein
MLLKLDIAPAARLAILVDNSEDILSWPERVQPFCEIALIWQRVNPHLDVFIGWRAIRSLGHIKLINVDHGKLAIVFVPSLTTTPSVFAAISPPTIKALAILKGHGPPS